ncbi:MAG: hypothetical protein EF812_02150 [Methanosarcinales archaeon]|nr:MAG: hypothetical protein EF812_02150 [Methanosarcinales archaeon]
MNSVKGFKIGIIVVIIVIISTAVIMYQPDTDKTKASTIDEITTPLPAPVTTVVAIPSSTTTSQTDTTYNSCENCHLTDKRSIPQADSLHNEMARYCMLCHTIEHNSHPMEDEGVSCNDCHGEKGAVPTLEEGAVRCGKCHSYPDPIETCNGNLITVHRPRGVACSNCHGDDVLAIHLSGKNVYIEDMLQYLERT